METVNQSTLRTGFGIDGRHITRVLEDSNVTGERVRNTIQYPASRAIEAVMRYKLGESRENGQLSPSDRRNLAQASKLEAEDMILRREWMPVADAVEIIGKLCDVVQRDVEQWDRDPEERREIVERLRDSIRQNLADWLGEIDADT